MESNQRILKTIERFKKNIGSNPEKVINELDHWYNCKNKIDDGATGEEHKIFVEIKGLLNILLKKR